MVAQNLMQLLVSFNNVGKDSQVFNATSRPIAKYGTRELTRGEIKGVVQPRDELKCGIHENALVAQH